MPLKVNGQEIPTAAIAYELDRLVNFYSKHMAKEQLDAQIDVLRARAREQVIGTKLLLDEARRLDIQVPPDEVDKRLQKMIEAAGGREKLEQVLRSHAQTIESMRAGIENGRRADILVERITAGIADPSDSEMRAHYTAHQAEYAKPEQVQVQHILIRPESESEDARLDALEEAESIRQKILDGADFAALAADHSDCPSGRRSGGSLGWIERGMLVPAFDQAAFSMEVDSISEAIATPLGYHIVRKTGHEQAKPAPYEEVRDRIHDFLRHVRRGEAIAAHIAELKSNAVIEDTRDA
jgi:parvulin-like peptidyl-prolyl isomerase